MSGPKIVVRKGTKDVLLMLFLGGASFALSLMFDSNIWNSLGAPYYVRALRIVVPVFAIISACYFLFIAKIRKDSLIIDSEGIVDEASLQKLGRLEWADVKSINVYKLLGEYVFVIEAITDSKKDKVTIKSMKLDKDTISIIKKYYYQIKVWH